MRIHLSMAGALLVGALFAMPTAAFADPASDNLVRAETQVQALNPADAASASPTIYLAAKTRLEEARLAAKKRDREDTMWRSDEALLNAEIVQEHIKLRGLERTVTETQTGVETLRRELKS